MTCADDAGLAVPGDVEDGIARAVTDPFVDETREFFTMREASMEEGRVYAVLDLDEFEGWRNREPGVKRTAPMLFECEDAS